LNRLKELIIAEPAFNYLDTWHYSTLPPNVTHIGFLSNIYASKGQLEALKHNLPTKLETFSLYYEAPTTRYTLSNSSMENYTLSNGVRVRVFNGKELAQVGMRSDLVKSSVFPRGVSVDNMRVMGRLGSSEARKHPGSTTAPSVLNRLKIPFVSKLTPLATKG
jgi:hypothetical protein